MRRIPATMIVILASAFCGSPASASPFWEPGDAQLRHDLQLVADYLAAPVLLTTWPISIDRSAFEIKANTPLDVAAAMTRLKQKLAESHSSNEYLTHVQVGAAKLQKPVALRTFQNQPREKAELEVGEEWLGETFAWRFNAQMESDPSDNKKARFDGSYLGAAMGNWAVTLGALDRWWGPGWDNSLILSNNARPVPSLALSRLENDAFDVPILNWLGPWNFVAFAGELDSQSSIPNTKLIGMRFTFAPIKNLEIGASRTMQWGGEGRPQGGKSLFDALIGRSNVGSDGVALGQDNSNQLAGFDARWVSPFFYRNYAIYTQLIGEDEAGYMPSLLMGLIGSEVWGYLRNDTSWRLVLEHTTTHADFLHIVQPNVAYEHSVYTDGYRYFGRVLGASVDSDARSTKITGMLADNKGNFWSASVRRTYFNNDGESISPYAPAKANEADISVGLQHKFNIVYSNIQLGLSRREDVQEEKKNAAHGSVEIKYVY